MSTLFTCKGLAKSYDKVHALDGLDLTIQPGRIVGLLGPNGSGKSTLMKLANGLLTPADTAPTDTGTLYFYGSDGVAFHIVAEYQMTEEGIVCIDFYFSYPKYGDINNLEYFHNTTGEWDPKVSEKVDMTYEQFEEIRKNLAARTVSIDAELLSEIG